jgi:hypothetical protein
MPVMARDRQRPGIDRIPRVATSAIRNRARRLAALAGQAGNGPPILLEVEDNDRFHEIVGALRQARFTLTDWPKLVTSPRKRYGRNRWL